MKNSIMIQQFHFLAICPKPLKSENQTFVHPCSKKHYSQWPKSGETQNVHQLMGQIRPRIRTTGYHLAVK